MKNKIFSFLLFVVLVLSLFTNWYAYLVWALLGVLLVMLLDKMGNGIVLRESISFFYILTCLIMPTIGYKYYSINNEMSRIWVAYMPVAKEIYFPFALPAVSAFVFAITLPLKGNLDSDQPIRDSVDKMKLILKENYSIATILIGLALFSMVASPFLPGVTGFITTLFYYAGFAGFLYLLYAPRFKMKIGIMIVFLIVVIASALAQAMFTIVAYMGITVFSFFFLGNKTSLIRKVMIFTSAILFFIVLQNTKGAYRKVVWKYDYKESKAVLFAKLFIENIQKGDALIEKNAFFPLYIRANQGFNIGLVMKRIPKVKPHDEGDRLITVFASAFVPRFLWPDKPEAGGKFNMAYYAGWDISGWSTNVGPLGEAYGSFGRIGGILYMFLLGLFVRWAYTKVFSIGQAIPLIICWLPVLFYQITYSAETDTLAILNSYLKGAFFIWLLYKFFPTWFGGGVAAKLAKQLKTNLKTRKTVPQHG